MRYEKREQERKVRGREIMFAIAANWKVDKVLHTHAHTHTHTH